MSQFINGEIKSGFVNKFSNLIIWNINNNEDCKMHISISVEINDKYNFAELAIFTMPIIEKFTLNHNLQNVELDFKSHVGNTNVELSTSSLIPIKYSSKISLVNDD